MDFSTFFDLGKTQAELDFVNVDPERDTRVFVDPYALEVKDDQWSNRCADHIRSFFQAVLQAIRSGDEDRARHLLSNLHESQETFLGLSSGVPRGRGIGSGNATQLYEALLGSRAVHTGLISDLAEAELFIAGIGRDKVSDLTTNIIRGPLIEYTKEQCDLHGVPLQEAVVAGPIWVPSREDWVQRTHALPIVQGRPVILVPKYSVRRRLSLESHEFYDKHFITFLQAEYQRASGSLAQVMRRVTKKEVKEQNPFSKEELADFALNNPHVLQLYRELAKSSGPMAADDLDEGFDERAFAGQLAAALPRIPTGRAHASAYHKLIIGLLSFLFFPGLIEPVKEAELHEGRKRLDIRFTNAGATPFFNRIVSAAQTRALTVPVECKNYTEDLDNPEFDQLSGRFSHTRGFFGFLCCRSIDNRDRMVATCRDTAIDGRGYIIVLSDDDLVQMLAAVESGNRSLIDATLNRRLGELLT
ncbi:hypothetical protein ABH972_005410 [Bradyrhizobium ottawaense]|uniref:hypothetical protein n=1 Tax=Bradyrhizobium ottawaense TaxID=931866 RepID=UPI00339AAF5A